MNPNTSTFMPLTVPPIAIRPDARTPLKATAQPAGTVPTSSITPGLILFGRDDRGRAHASSFAAADVDAATRAATLMDLQTLVITEAHQMLAAGLPQGRLFESGKAFVPFCSARMYTDLLAATGLPDAPPVRAANKAAEAPPASNGGSGSGGAAGGAGGAAKAPGDGAPTDPWAGITLGSVVLAKGDNEDGFYAAKVIATKANQNFVLTWVDYPDLLEFTRHRHALGLLHPGPAPQAK